MTGDGYKLHSVVLGVDPGMHTGVTALRVWKLDKDGTIPGPNIFTHPMIKGFGVATVARKNVFDGLHNFIDGFTNILDDAVIAATYRTEKPVPVFIAVERFVITQKSTTEGAGNAMETIGSLKTIVRQRYPGRVFIDVTQKSNTKGTITNGTLTALGLKWRNEGLPDHAYDSARHAVKLITRFRELGVRGVAKGCWTDEHTRSV